jgi:hypothetical protein
MDRVVRSMVLLTCVGTLLAGCGKKQANCENAITNLIKIEFYGHGRNQSREERKMFDAMMPGEKAKLVDWCERREFSAEDLQCVTDAKNHADWIGCGAFNGDYGPPLPKNMPSP